MGKYIHLLISHNIDPTKRADRFFVINEYELNRFKFDFKFTRSVIFPINLINFPVQKAS